MNAIGGLLIGVAVLLAIPVTVLFAQVLAALPRRRPSEMPIGGRPRVAVLMPAHNEAAVIAGTLDGVRAQIAPGDRLLVVADNCTDETARIAREAGAEVLERVDARSRGKGYALDFGVQALKADPPDVLAIVDADCELAPQTLDRIARTCMASGRPVQALYLMRSPQGAGIGRRIGEFAWVVKNQVRPLGGMRMGMPCQLMGTGMAFPWQSMQATSLATGHIAEDVLFGIRLAGAGAPPLFCPDALVTSEFAETDEGAQSQRRRWEHGNLALILAEAPRLFIRGVVRGDVRMAGMALDLAVPPLALLAMLVLAATAFAGGFALATGAVTPLAVSLAVLVSLSLAVLLAWRGFGRHVVSFAQLAAAPLYALRKLPLYFGFLFNRQQEWVRTRRGRR